MTDEAERALAEIETVLAALDETARDQVLQALQRRWTTERERALYRERAVLIAHLGSLHPAFTDAEPDDEGRVLVYLYLSGDDRLQMSRHIDAADWPLFAHVTRVRPESSWVRWDHHSKRDSLQRITADTADRAQRQRSGGAPPLYSEIDPAPRRKP